MKILNLSLDNSIFKKNSKIRERFFDYADLVDKYFVVAPFSKNIQEDLNEKISIFGSGGKNKITQLFKIYFLAKKLVKKNQFEIISVQDQYYLAWLGYCLAKKNDLALELQVHGFEKFSGLRKLIAHFVIKRADGIRVVSQRLKRKLVSEFGVPEDRITVVPIYIKLKIKNESRSVGIKINKENRFIFLTVSRFVAVKNIQMQIEAMREIVKKYPKTELWLVGDGELRGNFQSLITNYQLENNVKILGWQDDLEKFYQEANCFVLTSNSEGWGMAVIEAAGYSLPIIMTDVGLAGEVIQNKESGIIISVGDQKALETAMIKIIENQSLREKLGKNARQAIENLPSKEDTLNLYLEGWIKTKRNSNAVNSNATN